MPWGHQAALELQSAKPATLLEALTDIYEVVVINTGPIGPASALKLFDGVDGRLVLVTERDPEPAKLRSALAEAIALGYEVKQVVSPPQTTSAVA